MQRTARRQGPALETHPTHPPGKPAVPASTTKVMGRSWVGSVSEPTPLYAVSKSTASASFHSCDFIITGSDDKGILRVSKPDVMSAGYPSVGPMPDCQDLSLHTWYRHERKDAGLSTPDSTQSTDVIVSLTPLLSLNHATLFSVACHSDKHQSSIIDSQHQAGATSCKVRSLRSPSSPNTGLVATPLICPLYTSETSPRLPMLLLHDSMTPYSGSTSVQ